MMLAQSSKKKNKTKPSYVQEMEVLPFYAGLHKDEQSQVFMKTPEGKRKVVVSTNLAETSLTIPGIRHVIDSGQCKLRYYDYEKQLDSLKTFEISKASAIQRAGRAGREADGECLRLYTSDHYDKSFTDFTTPEILRVNFSATMLALISMGIKDISTFPLIDQPKPAAIRESIKELKDLGAIDEDLNISERGKWMNLFPFEPQISFLLLTSFKEQYKSVKEEVMKIISILSIPNGIKIEFKKNSKVKKNELLHYLCPDSDHLTLLSIFEQYEIDKKAKFSFIDSYSLFQANLIYRQLKDIVSKHPPNDLILGNEKMFDIEETTKEKIIIQCLYDGLPLKRAKLSENGLEYKTKGGALCKIYPGSALYDKKIPSVLFQEVVFTTHPYMRIVTQSPI